MDTLQDVLELLSDHRSMLWLNSSIILSALFPIYTGSHASLSRPASAAPPKKEKERGLLEDEEEEETLQPMEALTATDAIFLPVLAASVLAILYWLINRYGAEVINLIMSWYLAGAGIYSVIKLFCDSADLLLGFNLPSVYGYKGQLWSIERTAKRTAFRASDKASQQRSSPFPGLLGAIPLPRGLTAIAWSFRNMIKQKYTCKIYVKEILSVKSKITIVDMLATALGGAAVIYSNLISNHWLLTNVQGFAVSYLAIQLISPASFAIGSLVLSGLFFYDIWAVFFTPLMVTVATKLDQPIKLVFPRYDVVDDKEVLRWSMLGLGDIVLPGLMIGLCLRYDLYMFYLRKQTREQNSSKSEDSAVVKAPYTSPRGHWSTRFWTRSLARSMLPLAIQNASFPKPYFYASVIGYSLGLATTLGIVTIYQNAQPALLYLVPYVLAFVWGTAIVRGELKQMWNYSEELTGDAILDQPGDQDSADKRPQVDAQKNLTWWQSIVELFSATSDNNDNTKLQDSKTSTAESAGSRELPKGTDDPGPDTVVEIVLTKIRSADAGATQDAEVQTDGCKAQDTAQNGAESKSELTSTITKG